MATECVRIQAITLMINSTTATVTTHFCTRKFCRLISNTQSICLKSKKPLSKQRFSGIAKRSLNQIRYVLPYYHDLFCEMPAFSESIWYGQYVGAGTEAAYIDLFQILNDQTFHRFSCHIGNYRFFRFIYAIEFDAELVLVGIGPYHYAYCRFAHATHCFYQRIMRPVVQVYLVQAIVADTTIPIRVHITVIDGIGAVAIRRE